jgi:hypothetical protein
VLADGRLPPIRPLDSKLITEKDLTLLLPLHEELRRGMLPDHSWNGRQVVLIFLQQPLIEQHLLHLRHWLLLTPALATEAHLVDQWLSNSRNDWLECFPKGWLVDYFVLAVFAGRVVVGGVGDEILRDFDALAGYPAQLFGLALIIFAEIVNLANKLFEGRAVGLLGIRSVIGEEQDLVLERFVGRGVLQAYVEVAMVQSGFFLNLSSWASMIL